MGSWNDNAYGITSNTWGETTITRNNAPPLPGSALASTTIGTAAQYYEWDVTSFVAAQGAGPPGAKGGSHGYRSWAAKVTEEALSTNCCNEPCRLNYLSPLEMRAAPPDGLGDGRALAADTPRPDGGPYDKMGRENCRRRRPGSALVQRRRCGAG
jgi:hypothetical protein